MPAGSAVYSLAAVPVAVDVVVALHVVEPEFDPSWRMMSEYSLGRYGVLMRVAFLAGGSSVIAVAVALSGSAWPGSLGLVLVAIGPLGAAFVDTDPITTPRTMMSRRSKVPAGLGALFILGFPMAATVAGVAAAGDPEAGQVLAWASVVPWIGLAWFVVATIRHASPDGRGAPEARIGWPNRLSILTYFGWVALAAVRTLT